MTAAARSATARVTDPHHRDPVVMAAVALLSRATGHETSRYITLLAADIGGRPWSSRDGRAMQRAGAFECPRPMAAATADRRQLVMLVPVRPGAGVPDVRAVADEVVRWLAVTGHEPVVVGSGLVCGDGVVAAVEEACLILRVVRALAYPAGAYQLDDVPFETALARSPDIAARLAARIEPLTASDAPLLETLTSYLDNGADRRRTARLLYIHPNTLLYRLRRVRELTGLSPTVPRDILTLRAAMIAWRLGSVESA
ncbi:MAG: helix-turn-helix domain-containing protein [Actinophytocola sp.]|uniref:PucR family transcriptional regulator n=1 Tax=Actinophytocola sp. TaxID=1872138 RepID=UPI003C766D0E